MAIAISDAYRCRPLLPSPNKILEALVNIVTMPPITALCKDFFINQFPSACLGFQTSALSQ